MQAFLVLTGVLVALEAVQGHILHTQDHRVPPEQLEAEARLRQRRLREGLYSWPPRSDEVAAPEEEAEAPQEKEKADEVAVLEEEAGVPQEKEKARRRLLLSKRGSSAPDEEEHSRLRLSRRVRSRGLSHGKGGEGCFSHGCSKNRKCGAGGTLRTWGKCKKYDGDNAEFE